VNLALDINAYSALHAGDETLAGQVRRADRIGLPIIVIGELRFGFLHGSRLAANEATLERFQSTRRVEVLHVTEATTRLFGEIATLLRHNGEVIQQNDIWIAALCKQYGFALASHDQGFEHVLGLRVIRF
jgi:tRNA(fMet)-specific endonuclease VapC